MPKFEHNKYNAAPQFPQSRNAIRLRFASQQVESDGSAYDLLHVAADNGNLRHDPQEESWSSFVLPMADLGEMQARDDAETRGQPLHQQSQNGCAQQYP